MDDGLLLSDHLLVAVALLEEHDLVASIVVSSSWLLLLHHHRLTSMLTSWLQDHTSTGRAGLDEQLALGILHQLTSSWYLVDNLTSSLSETSSIERSIAVTSVGHNDLTSIHSLFLGRTVVNIFTK